MDIDITTLTVLATNAMNTFFGTALESAGAKVGEAAIEQGKRIYEAIKERFSKEQDDGKASRALVAMVDDPQESGDPVQRKLVRILEDDPDFAQYLQQLIQSGPHQMLTAEEEAQVRRIRQENSARIGSQDITLHKRAIGEDITQQIN